MMLKLGQIGESSGEVMTRLVDPNQFGMNQTRTTDHYFSGVIITMLLRFLTWLTFSQGLTRSHNLIVKQANFTEIDFICLKKL